MHLNVQIINKIYIIYRLISYASMHHINRNFNHARYRNSFVDKTLGMKCGFSIHSQNDNTVFESLSALFRQFAK